MPGDQYDPYLPRIEEALLRYFALHGEAPPDPVRLRCLARFAANIIDRRSYGFRSTVYNGMASFLVPAYLYPNHREHKTVAGFVGYCAQQAAAAGAPDSTEAMKVAKVSPRLAKDVGRIEKLSGKAAAASRAPRSTRPG